MREILFRGKAINREEGREYRTSYKNGDWVYGLVTKLYDERFELLPATMTNEYGISGIEVDHNTIGQYTGLTANGKEIFEGDIVKITGFHTTAIAAVKYGSSSEKSTSWGWYFDDNDGHTYFLVSRAFCEDYNAIIIGNIHDNPELLKGE